MKKAFEQHCEGLGISVVRIDGGACEIELPRSASDISQFLAESPLQTPTKVDLFAGLSNLVDQKGLKLLKFDNWSLSVEPLGGVPPTGGMLRLKVEF